MGRSINYAEVAEMLAAAFKVAEHNFLNNDFPRVNDEVAACCQILFQSNTQAFREALVGCCLARLHDREIDVALPYMNQGELAYNGRTLDERVVNPFFREKEIPCSKGPFLSVFRRNVRFAPETGDGVRDKNAFRAMLRFLEVLRGQGELEAEQSLQYLLCKFIEHREESRIILLHVRRLSLNQYEILLRNLLAIPSGGLFPLIMSVAMFRSISRSHDLGWEVKWQGINVADATGGAGGDISILRAGEPVLTIEVTEREVDDARVRSTFSTKILPQNIEDYLFLVTNRPPTEEAKRLAESYFGQGHEIGFAPIVEWASSILTVLGPAGRAGFTENMIELLEGADIPAALKVAWNEQVRAVTAPGAS